MTDYRIRWDRIEYYRGNGKSTTERMCLAEKSKYFLGLKFWVFVSNGNWRFNEYEAEQDIENDKSLYEPFPPVRYFELVEKSA